MVNFNLIFSLGVKGLYIMLDNFFEINFWGYSGGSRVGVEDYIVTSPEIRICI